MSQSPYSYTRTIRDISYTGTASYIYTGPRLAWDGWKIEEPTKESIDMPDNDKPRLFPFRAVAWNTDSNEVLFDEGVVMAVDSTSARNKVVKQLVVANAEIDLDEVEIAVHPF